MLALSALAQLNNLELYQKISILYLTKKALTVRGGSVSL